MNRTVIALSAAALMLASCKPDGKVGEACVVSGDGFTRTDSCAEMCVNWEVTCPDGGTVTPEVCSGQVCGTSGTCPSGQFCMQVDSFEANSRCMPLEVCGLSAPAAAMSSEEASASEESGAESEATTILGR